MPTFAQQCGVHYIACQAALAQTVALIEAGGVELVRFA